MTETETCPKCGMGIVRWGVRYHDATCKVLSPDLQAPVRLKKDTPQLREKMVRSAFSSRGWPNEDHKGTVRDFMVEHAIPCI